ncbi:sn-glycerol 3-phosphate transport system ATP-binding protein/multiple sugar transport system ATP-binding protein [Sodalis ligni]|uniref:sn-glycerol 3-phosphate transport system ATP-binding protein/multiple sugar transport system ATP-binding protein n=1 Tax=Sodalis ligni TaxID=2697027 RepID=A0A4R1NEI6_9GAMM|nr:sn-glycerol 3-phosphate transport system ATP-binding protein/multiple sugar transport system ATP-binding protein [Sodalis ligni]
MASIELQQVSKIYQNNQYSVRDVNLKINDGEFVIFLGPSGCGKSTTLRMIAGLESITSGELRINGQNVNRVAPRDRNIAVVFQSYALYPHMTVAENMAFGLKMRGTPAAIIRQKVAETAAMLGLDQLLHRKPAALSGGQRQRVALGRAIVREPQAFLLDEPLSNLDAQLRAEMRTELIKLHRRLGKTMVYVTHDQVEAMTMGDRICIMRDGYLVQSGTPLEVYANPANTFVAQFLSSPPINLVSCIVRSRAGEIFLELDGGRLIRVSDYAQQHYRRHEGKPVTLGIRPEDFHARQHGAHWQPLPFNVTAVEALGRKISSPAPSTMSGLWCASTAIPCRRRGSGSPCIWIPIPCISSTAIPAMSCRVRRRRPLSINPGVRLCYVKSLCTWA